MALSLSSCNLPHLSSSSLSSTTRSHRSQSLSIHPCRPLPLSLSLTRCSSFPSSPLSVRSVNPWIKSVESTGRAGVDPSLRHANVLFFKSAYNVQIVVDDNEPEEALLRRFRREVIRAGVIQECKRRRFFENKHEEKKRKARELAKKNRRRRSGPRFSSSAAADENAASKKKSARDDDDEDNWEMPQNLPF